MSIDRMDWHYGADNFPKDLDPECGGTHIGFYLTWIIDNDLAGEFLLEDAEKEMGMVKNREMTGRDFLIEICDEKFWEDDLNEEGNEFTSYYYGTNVYFNDLDQVFEGYTYRVENTWDNYEKIGKVISKRYGEWKAK